MDLKAVLDNTDNGCGVPGLEKRVCGYGYGYRKSRL